MHLLPQGDWIFFHHLDRLRPSLEVMSAADDRATARLAWPFNCGEIETTDRHVGVPVTFPVKTANADSKYEDCPIPNR